MTTFHCDGRVLVEPCGRQMACSMGRSGLIDADRKREGDGATPLGSWRILRAFYRADRLRRPNTALPISVISQSDGWCDDPGEEAYNQAVRLPFSGSHEVLWREDGLYDLIVVLDHNLDPAVPGLGSGVFLHCRAPDGGPTAGCISVAMPDLLNLLKSVKREDILQIERTLTY